MGREVRRVPKGWHHPRDQSGNYIPLYNGSIREKIAKWDEGKKLWQEGFVSLDGKKIRKDEFYLTGEYEGYAGLRPAANRKDYMPDWLESEKTHFRMYETVSEGTPISPVMESPEALARWLADNKANAGAGFLADYEQWLAMIIKGSSSSFMLSSSGDSYSGVEACSRPDR